MRDIKKRYRTLWTIKHGRQVFETEWLISLRLKIIHLILAAITIDFIIKHKENLNKYNFSIVKFPILTVIPYYHRKNVLFLNAHSLICYNQSNLSPEEIFLVLHI